MHRKKSFNSVSGALGAAFVASAISLPLSAAEPGNPFAATDLGSGYQLASKDAEGKCGEGKCGEGKKAAKEGKCGEGKCGEGKKAAKEGKCGEGKCGEGKKTTKSQGGEGKCGEGKCGA